jgi:hypothetical protein
LEATIFVVAVGECLGSFKKLQKAAYSAGKNVSATFPPEESDFFSIFKKSERKLACKLVADYLMPAK